MIIAYLFLVLFVGLYNYKTSNSNDYLFASRKLTLPSFIATIVTTWYGGILELGRFTYYHGIVTWIIFGLFYYISAIIFALYIGPKIHENNIKSIPEYFYKYLGNIPGLIASILIFLISSPAPYILILSSIITNIYNVDISVSILISILCSTIYIYNGGLKSIIRTDKIQFIFMYLGFAVMLFYLYNNFGGINFIIKNVPKGHFQLTDNLPISYILSWFFISFIIVIDPSIFQRTYSTKNITTVKKGLLISIFFWFIFDIMTLTTGLYAAAIISEVNLTTNPYLLLSDMVLPVFWKNIFLISLLSIVMSTIDSTFFVSSITIGQLIKKYIKHDEIKIIRICLLITGVVSLILCYNFENAINIWYVFGSIGASSILIPFLGLLFINGYNVKYESIVILLPLLIFIFGPTMRNDLGYYVYPFAVGTALF